MEGPVPSASEQGSVVLIGQISLKRRMKLNGLVERGTSTKLQ